MFGLFSLIVLHSTALLNVENPCSAIEEPANKTRSISIIRILVNTNDDLWLRIYTKAFIDVQQAACI